MTGTSARLDVLCAGYAGDRVASTVALAPALIVPGHGPPFTP